MQAALGAGYLGKSAFFEIYRPGLVPAMGGKFRRKGKIWVRVLADLPITGKPTEVRMGRGKGNLSGWIARVSTGQILFEMDGVSLSNARQAARLAAHKPCSSTKFVQWS